MYAKRMPPEEPPCYSGNAATKWIPCRIDPIDENRDALNIFWQVRYQLIMGFGEPIDINHLAVDAAMKREGIAGQRCFDKVLTLGRWWIERIRNKDNAG